MFLPYMVLFYLLIYYKIDSWTVWTVWTVISQSPEILQKKV